MMQQFNLIYYTQNFMKHLLRSKQNKKKLFDDLTLNEIESKDQAESSYANALQQDNPSFDENQPKNQHIVLESPTNQISVKPKNVFNEYERFQQKPINKSLRITSESDKQQVITENTKEQKTQIISFDDETDRKNSDQQVENYVYEDKSQQEKKQNQENSCQQNQMQQVIINQNSTKRKLLDTQDDIENGSTLVSYGSQSLMNDRKLKLNLKPVRVDGIDQQQYQNQEKLDDKYLAVTQPYSPNIFRKKLTSNKYVSFASKQIDEDYKLKLIIKRESKYMGWNVNYSAHFQSDDRYLMSAFKMSHSHMMTHHMSVNPNVSQQNSQQYLGKIKSNFMHNAINIISPGYSPEQSYKDPANSRQVLATVKFTSDAVYQSSLPKNIKVYVLNKEFEYSQLQGYNKDSEINLQDLYQYDQNKNKITVYRNRRPIWNQDSKGFVLDFHGRVKVPSVKNFILEIDDPKSLKETQQVLLFGKIQKDQFLMEVSSPLSPRLAFGIILTICSTA